MTDTIEHALEEADGPYRPPFLRISGTFPAGDGEYTTLTVELNVNDDGTDLGEVTTGDGAVRSWMTDFVTEVIREMRPPPPGVLVLGGRLRDLFATSTDECTTDDDPTEPAGDQPEPAPAEGGR